jgi:hypothetical protein
MKNWRGKFESTWNTQKPETQKTTKINQNEIAYNGLELAEREGFEPPIPVKVCRFSSSQAGSEPF